MASEIVEKLKQTLPVCPYDRRSPYYWKGMPICPVCHSTETGPDLCRGADTRIMDEAATTIEAMEARVRVMDEHLSNVIGYAEEWYRHIGWDATFGDDYNVTIKAARAAIKEEKL